jgi:molecular chaperone GrpE
VAKNPKTEELEQQIGELTADLQRMRADFENYRKRVDAEKQAAREDGEVRAILKLLPVVDTIERAVAHIPDDIAEHQWVKGVAGLVKQLEKSLGDLKLQKINSKSGADFNPEFHQAIQFDEEATGDKEVIAEELQPGYTLSGRPIRHAMVKVTRK